MITGGTVKKVNAERMKEGPNQGMDINIRVTDTKWEKTKLPISYVYEVAYKPDMAKMAIEGELHFEDSEKDLKVWKEHWEKTNQLPEGPASDFLTALTYTASAVGTLLAFAVNINAPINVPRAKLTQVQPGSSQAA